MNTGDKVRVLAPFNDSFPGEYDITEVIAHEDGQVVYVLGDIGGFAPEFLEVV